MPKDLPINLKIVEQMAKATIKNLVDGTVELVTNCDDSYKRLEHEGHKAVGEMEIHASREKGGICEYLKVKDFAEGMSKEELEKAIVFAGETKGKSIRGLFGRGLKETIIALGDGEIKTIKDGKISKTRLWLNKKIGAQYDDEMLEKIEYTSEQNGTEVNIQITNDKIKIPEYEKFKEQISRHYALRDINSSTKRKTKLFFEDKKRKLITKEIAGFQFPEGKKVVEEKINLPYFGDEVKIVIYESPNPLDSPRYNPFGLAGILIKTKSAILDNQLFKFENDPVALYFFGEATCDGLEERLRKGETEIIDPNRSGLEWKHDYCLSLSKAIEKFLEPLVFEKRKALQKTPEKEAKESTKKMIRKLCSELNRLAKLELEDISEFHIEEPEPDITDLLIKPEAANIPLNKPRILSIYAPTEVVENEGQEANIKSDNIDIRPLSSTVRLEKHSKFPEKIFYRYFKVEGSTEGAEGNIVVNLGKKTATAKVKVAPFKKKKKGKLTGKKGGFISDISLDGLINPPQRVEYREGIIRVYWRFPSTSKFIKSGFEGVEKAEARILLSELVGEAFCRELARQQIEYARYPSPPGGEIDSFNVAINDLQRKTLHLIQEIIFAWKF